MKPYLRPRWSGIDTLELYKNGFQKYLSCRSCDTFGMIPFHGTRKFQDARKVLKEQIDKGIPVPYLLLKHKNPAFRDYEWHWFLITGYGMHEDKCMIKAVTYESWKWIDFEELWNTRYQRLGGLNEVLFINIFFKSFRILEIRSGKAIQYYLVSKTHFGQ